MLRPSRCIGIAELHEGAIFFDTVRFTDCLRATYMSTCEKITRTKSHVYLELSAKRASVRTYINMHARKKLTYFYICLLKIRHERVKKNHLGLLLDLSSKDMAIELMYINMHVRGNLELTATKDKAHV